MSLSWKDRYNTDPAFRLERLLKLRRRFYARNGGPYANSRAYDAEIERAKAALAAPRFPAGPRT